MKSCDRHPWRYAMCPDCTAVNQSVTLRAVYDDIDTVRQEVRHTLKVKRMAEQYQSRPVEDRPLVLTDAVDENGTVVRVRMLGWEELLDVIERSVIGETDAP
jgi:hypothetical protein